MHGMQFIDLVGCSVIATCTVDGVPMTHIGTQVGDVITFRGLDVSRYCEELKKSVSVLSDSDAPIEVRMPGAVTVHIMSVYPGHWHLPWVDGAKLFKLGFCQMNGEWYRWEEEAQLELEDSNDSAGEEEEALRSAPVVWDPSEAQEEAKEARVQFAIDAVSTDAADGVDPGSGE